MYKYMDQLSKIINNNSKQELEKIVLTHYRLQLENKEKIYNKHKNLLEFNKFNHRAYYLTNLKLAKLNTPFANHYTSAYVN